MGRFLFWAMVPLVVVIPLSCSSGPEAAPPSAGPPGWGEGEKEVEAISVPYPTPPGVEELKTLEELGEAPTFTPFTVRPDVKNRAEVAGALVREYPPDLRKRGVSGTVTVWFFIDAEGTVRKAQINESSGHEALDAAALRVARIMEFTPASHKEKNVPVWISLPITFTARQRGSGVRPPARLERGAPVSLLEGGGRFGSPE